VAQARAAIASRLRPIDEHETAPLALDWPGAGGRRDRAHRCAGTRQLGDGRLCFAETLRADVAIELRSVATVMAGTPHHGVLERGECAHLTGAVMMPGPTRWCRWNYAK
jgi:hypothetical protein